MNKKDAAAFAALQEQLALAMALRWTERVAPDVPIPSTGLSLGYLPIASMSDSARVTEACSSSASHGQDHKKTSTQQPRALYSTRGLALRALRYEVEEHCAKRLARIDGQIEALKEHA